MISKRTIRIAVLAASILFKFWLIAEMEITDDSDDPPNYVTQILTGGPSFFGPGTGLAGAFFRAAGIPFRDGIEIAYLVACLLVVKALFDWPVKSYLALGLFLFISFNPTTEEMFSHIMSDQVWLVEILIGLSLFVISTTANRWTRWHCLALASVMLGFSTITRTTIIPLMATLVVWTIISGVLYALKGQRRSFDFTTAAGWVACVALAGIFNWSTCSYNSQHYGYFGLSLPDSREYHDFYMCLQSVGEPTGEKYYPVDNDRLDLIAQAGPASNWFVQAMRTDANFKRVSQENFGKFDLALAWFHFVVFFNTMPEGNLKQGFTMFKAVEKEIALAGQEHRLNVRPILPLPDCRIAIVLSALPEAARSLSGLITAIPSRYAWSMTTDHPKYDNPYFTQALTRRAVAASPLRENIGRILCSIYSIVYTPMLIALMLSVGACLAGGIYYWKKIPAVSFRFLTQQLIGFSFAIFFAWHVLFDASGIPPIARHVLYQNALLPLLLVYYAGVAWKILSRYHPRFQPTLATKA